MKGYEKCLELRLRGSRKVFVKSYGKSYVKNLVLRTKGYEKAFVTGHLKDLKGYSA